MNLSRIDALLTFAFQHTDGLIGVAVRYWDHYEYLQLTPAEIKKLSENEKVVMIELDQRQDERRWRDRDY